MLLAEVGPERVGHPDLGVGDLPEQEVADAHLAARPDQQIGIGLAGGVEGGREPLLVQLLRSDPGGDEPSGGLDDLGAAAVVERDVEQHAAVLRGLLLGRLQLAADIGGELPLAADDVETDVVLQQGVQLEPQVALEQRHQRRHLGHGALPVLDREGVEREHLDPEARRRLDDVADRFDPGAVPLDAREMPLRRPPAVAVHDDRDVSGEPLEINLPCERLFGRPGRDDSENVLERHGAFGRINRRSYRLSAALNKSAAQTPNSSTPKSQKTPNAQLPRNSQDLTSHVQTELGVGRWALRAFWALEVFSALGGSWALGVFWALGVEELRVDLMAPQ